MWTADMNRCPGCGDKNECKDRKEIVQTLSALNMKLNTEAEHADGPGDGTIIVNCQYQPVA